ncbi:plexin-A3-like [Mytilus trossulus]|uniref:plexin-A3-like n=1 Tax=Mytilus trossulus TaxID=6551 RepID=UPI003003A889
MGYMYDLDDADCSLDSDTQLVTCIPQINKVSPLSGPVDGGTLVTVVGKFLGNVNDSISVEISGVMCHNVTVTIPGTRLTCVIGEDKNKTEGIFVSVNSNNFSDPNTTYFSFKKPRIINVRPSKGIVSGGTTVIISGQNIDFKGQNRYNITFCDDEICIECRETHIVLNQVFRNLR